MANNTEATSSLVLFTSLNGYEVTAPLLAINGVILLIGILTLVSNAYVLDTVVRRTSLEATDLVMCHLAVTDMLTGVLVIHTVGYNLINFQNFTECLMRLGVVFTFVCCSVNHLALLTVDRFVKIVFPYRYQDIISRKSVSIISAAIWVFSVNLGLIPAYGWRHTPEPSEPACSLLGVLTAGYIQMGLSIIYLPFVLICILYMKIFLVVRRHSRAIAATDISGNSNSGSSMKFTKTVVILIGAYIISFSPLAMIALVFTFGGFHDVSAFAVGDYIVYASVLTFANSLVNPIIYSFKLPPVRRRLLRFLGKSDNSLNSTTSGTVQTVVTDVD
ncbi:adenosine receptor A3-like [Haliotis asinina]|uniref:adenosine receptor A3-like n=1 Tax=Haliotis asinina TaxID=109174 RepID=UPI0035320BC1